MTSIEEANAALQALEAPKHRHAHAAHFLASAVAAPVHADKRIADLQATLVSEAQAEHTAASAAFEAHTAAHGGERALSRKIDVAAQAVLDARGEKHTEKNILAPGTSAPEPKETV